jgi:acetolactate decarboxylase
VTSEVHDDQLVPFAVITRFEADRKERLLDIDSLVSLERKMDVFRSSQNIFTGVQLDGVFDELDLRAACKAAAGEDLVTATNHQSEFRLENVEGTLVGFWTPAYAKTLNVAGYHLHFISADRNQGGHLLNLNARELSATFHFETDFHMAIPETPAFLEADLRSDPSQALDVAEKTRKRD